MKWMKLAVVIASATAFGRAYAFHEGGVAYCDGCHSMHNSSANKSMSGGRNTTLAGWNAAGKASTTPLVGNAFLLQGSDNSSTCLNCHAANDTKATSYHVMTFPAPAATGAPMERTPGGDFSWLSITKTGVVRGSTVVNAGERHGHNIVAQDYGLIADATLTAAPGGDYPAANLSCASCHDPHSRARIVDAAGTIQVTAFGSATLPIGGSGSYGAVPSATEAVGVYRLLAPAKYSQMSLAAQGVNPTAFNANPPVAVAPSTYNQTEATNDVRVAYGSGMSEWCANCHRNIHNDNVNAANTGLIHPAGNGAKLAATANDLNGNANGTTIAAIYNAYKKSGDLTGVSTGSYTSLVPYEEGQTDLVKLSAHAKNDGTATDGPSATGATENVMCLSCHRAHASGWSSMTRWNNKAEFLTIEGGYPGTDAASVEAQGFTYNQGYTQAQYAAAMYDRPATQYAVAQRSLCNKCHAKD